MEFSAKRFQTKKLIARTSDEGPIPEIQPVHVLAAIDMPGCKRAIIRPNGAREPPPVKNVRVLRSRAPWRDLWMHSVIRESHLDLLAKM
jgi:hypothetical protein